MSAEADAALEEVIALLQVGLPAEVVAAMLRIRLDAQLAWDEGRVAMERVYCDNEFAARLARLAGTERASLFAAGPLHLHWAASALSPAARGVREQLALWD